MGDVQELNINSTTYDIKAKSVVDQNSGKLKYWSGTKDQYDEIGTYYAYIYEPSGGALFVAYVRTATPTTSTTVYDSIGVTAALTISSVGTGTITLSDGYTYTYSSADNEVDTTEYDSDTLYNVIDEGSSSSPDIYDMCADISLSNLDDEGQLKLNSGKRNIGEIVESAVPLKDASLHLMDGSLIAGGGIYDDFVDYIAGLVTDYPSLFVTQAQWEDAVSTYGSCGKFVYDNVNGTVRLPKVSNILQGTTDATALGDLVQAGLPNITGQAVYHSAGAYGIVSNATGALYPAGKTTNYSLATGSASDSAYAAAGFNASYSNSIYGNSTTVQPQTIKVLYYIVIANVKKAPLEVDIDEIATDLNDKADRDLLNLSATGEAKFNGSTVPNVVLGGTTEYNATTGMASGFTSTNWGIINFYPNSNPWEIVFKAKFSSLSTAEYVFCGVSAYKYLGLFHENSVIKCNISTNETSWNIQLVGTTTLSTNTDYWIKVEFTGSAYNLKLSTDGTTYTTEATASSSATIGGAGYYLGRGYGGNPLYNGEIDLPNSYIKINGIYTWTGASTQTRDNFADRSLMNLSADGRKRLAGKWIYTYVTLSTATAVGDYEIDLKTYVTDDGCNYLCWFMSIFCAAANNVTYVTVSSSLASARMAMTNNNFWASAVTPVPVGADRKITYSIQGGAMPANTGALYLVGATRLPSG